MTKDYAYTRTKTVTKRQTIVAAFDAFISGLILIWFVVMVLGVSWLIFGK